jgi:hypothetical protein
MTLNALAQNRRGRAIRMPDLDGDRSRYQRCSYQPGPSANGDKITAKLDEVSLDICVCRVKGLLRTQFAM